ncbi:hypothetical protein N9061_03040 [bacterium]|nr:hypothetical protein [bacterium]
MTIKQLGGVFGRNPTFNDVTIDGTLTFDGDIDISSDLKISGDLEVTGTSKLDGNVAVGTTSSAWGGVFKSLDISGSAISSTAGGAFVESGNCYFNGSQWIYKNNGTATRVELNAGVSGATWYTASSGTGGDPILTFAQAMSLDSTNNLVVSNGNVVIGTSGKGIDFSATAGTGTSELFDDYEEGTFSITSDSGQVVIAANTGYYTKVGRVVTCTGAVSVASIGTPVGNVGFDGLPFATANATNIGAGISLYTYGWKTSMTTHVMASLAGNSSSWFVQKSNGAGSVAVLSGDVQATTYIQYTIVYQTA